MSTGMCKSQTAESPGSPKIPILSGHYWSTCTYICISVIWLVIIASANCESGF